MKERVLVAMSGGVDSSVACYLLKRKGYDCIGATIKTWPKEDCEKSGQKTCCSFEAISYARDAASKLGVPHYVFDFNLQFKHKIKDYYEHEYLQGRTPNPCVWCNSEIKFGMLLKKADELGCRYIASGHFARLDRSRQGNITLKKGNDPAKDQSYFLFNLRPEQLKRILFPLGEMTKEKVRGISKELGQKSYYSLSSQDICFSKPAIPSNKGKILFADGKVMGEHDGIFNFTIGQRKGLGIGYKEPLYVTKLDAVNNIVYVGVKSECLKRSLFADRLNWILLPKFPFRARAKIRYGQVESPAKIIAFSKDKVKVDFDEPQNAPTPGQAVVFYKRNTVLGGGWISDA